MKHILILCGLLLSINLSCQVIQTVPLQTLDYPNGAYLKDMQNELSFLVVTWEGTSNQIKYTFEFTLFPKVLKTYENDSFEYQDQLKGKFKAVNLTNNQLLHDNLNAVDIENYRLREFFLREQIEFDFGFVDVEANCYNSADFKLVKNSTDPNQITYKEFELTEFGLFYDGVYGCPYYQDQSDIPMFLPTEEMVLTRNKLNILNYETNILNYTIALCCKWHSTNSN